MSTSLREAFSELRRREFFGRLVAGGGAAAASLFGFTFDAAAHDERITLVGAALARMFGIVTYRVRQNASSDTTRIVAELLNQSGQIVGEFVRTRYFRKNVVEEYVKGQEFKHTKLILKRQNQALEWRGETFEVDTDVLAGTFDVKYDNRWIGKASVDPGKSQRCDPTLAALANDRSQLLRIAEVVGRDLDQLLPPPPRIAEGCCCPDGIGCYNIEHWCSGFGVTRTSACDSATDCMNSDCWNSYCIGCCASTGCNCDCAAGDFFCGCVNNGWSCGCDRHCI